MKFKVCDEDHAGRFFKTIKGEFISVNCLVDKMDEVLNKIKSIEKEK